VAQRLAVFPEELLQVAPQYQRAVFLAEKLGVVLPVAAQRAEERPEVALPGAGQQAEALLVGGRLAVSPEGSLRAEILAAARPVWAKPEACREALLVEAPLGAPPAEALLVVCPEGK
jgi:hypothetical protein